MRLPRVLARMLAAGTAALGMAGAHAQESYPSKVIRIVTAAPGISVGTMQEIVPCLAVEAVVMKLFPPFAPFAPRTKSVCPPVPLHWRWPSDSEQHRPRRSTSMVALIETMFSFFPTTKGSFT